MNVDQKEAIREAVDIVEIASRYLNIKKVGRRYQALCPFHSERTPSFSLDPIRQTYLCFGCGSKGDVFSLLMKLEGITFPETLIMLKEELGMDSAKIRPIRKKRMDVPKRGKFKDKILHEISCDLQNALQLTEEHVLHLAKDRRMSEDMIHANGYRSFPHEKPWAPFSSMQKRDYKGFPGAYTASGKKGPYWLLNNLGKGILIPFRNQYNYITGWQIRLDSPRPQLYTVTEFDEQFKSHQSSDGQIKVIWNGEIIGDIKLDIGESKKFISRVGGKPIELGEIGLRPGTKYFWLSSAEKENGTGACEPCPIHIAVPIDVRQKWQSGQLLQSPIAGITEGALKADIAADKMRLPFVSVPGISQCMSAIPSLIEMGVKQIILAFDMDIARKKELLEQIRLLKIELEKIDQFQYCEVMLWNEHDHGKGIDDCLNNRFMPKREVLFDKRKANS